MIHVETEGGLRTVTIDRPEKANALTRDMLVALAEAAESVPRDLGAFVLRGTGKVFSAGADLDQAKEGLATDPVWVRFSAAVAALPCLTIAALNGALVGGAMGMALACDIRIAVPGVKIFYPVMRLGYLPPGADSQRLVRLVGPARAKMILLAGQKIPAEEALSWGLIDRIVPAEETEAALAELTHDALNAAPAHVAALKSLI